MNQHGNQPNCVEIVGMMDRAYFASKSELLQWLQQDFSINIQEIEQCGSGAIYVQIMDRLFPGVVPMSKVRWSTKQSHEAIHNYKLLQAAFDKCNIKKNIEVEKLMKCKCQDNLEFLQWMKGIYDRYQMKPDAASKAPGYSYDPYRRRELGMGPYPDWAPPFPPGSLQCDNQSVSTGNPVHRHNVTRNPSRPRTAGTINRPQNSLPSSESVSSSQQASHSRSVTPVSRPRPVSQQTGQINRAMRGTIPPPVAPSAVPPNVGLRVNRRDIGQSIDTIDWKLKYESERSIREETERAVESSNSCKEFFYNKLVILERICEYKPDSVSSQLIKAVLFSATNVPADVVDFSKSDDEIIAVFDEFDITVSPTADQPMCVTTTGSGVPLAGDLVCSSDEFAMSMNNSQFNNKEILIHTTTSYEAELSHMSGSYE